METYQSEGLSKILHYSRNFVPYWQGILKERGPANLKRDKMSVVENLPVIRKRTITKNFSCMVSEKNVPVFKMATTGSTAEPLHFYVDQDFFIRRAFALHYALKYYKQDINSKIIRLSYKDFPWADFQGRYFDPSWLMIYGCYEIEKLISEYKARVLYGTVSHVLALAEFSEKNFLDFKFDLVITRSEHLTPSLRKYFESIFGARVYNIYASREFGPIAQECIFQNGFHVNEDMIFLEIVDDSGRQVQDGAVGNILITSFYNRSMPFIRYLIGDRGMFISKECSCGLKTRKIVLEGRTCDFIYLANGRRFPVSDLFKPLSIKGIRAFQLVQPRINELIAKIAVNPSFSHYDKNVIETKIKRGVFEAMNLGGESVFWFKVEMVSDIPLLPNGKRKILISNLNYPLSEYGYDGIFV